MPRTPVRKFEAIVALMASGLELADVAKRLGMTRRAFYDIRQSDDFKQVYRRVRSEMLTASKDNMVGSALAASKLLRELVEDDRYETRDRAAAAKFLLESANRFLDAIEIEDKAAENEDDVLVPIPGRRGDVK